MKNSLRNHLVEKGALFCLSAGLPVGSRQTTSQNPATVLDLVRIVGKPYLRDYFRVARDSGTSIGSLRHGWLTFDSRFLMWSFECVSCDSGIVPMLLNSYNMPLESVSG